MNRLEALHTLGLEEGASVDDIRIAYRETAQILHPDKFIENKKLQDRATEQFKRLQDAYRFLMDDAPKASATATRGRRGQASGEPQVSAFTEDEVEYNSIHARLAGITAARTQLVAQRDVVADERRTGLYMVVIGAVMVLLTMRRAFGLLGVISAIGLTLAVWGVTRMIACQRSLTTLDEHLDGLSSQRRQLESQLDEFEVVYE